VLSGRLLALAALAGAALGAISSVDAAAVFSAALAVASIAVRVGAGRWRLALVLLSVGALFAGRSASAREATLRPPLARWLDGAAVRDHRGPILARGVLTEDAAPADDGARLSVAVSEVDDGRGWRAAAGCAQVHVSGVLATARLPAWTAGRSWQAPVTFKPAPIWLNPGGPSVEWQMLRRRCVLTGTIKSGALVEVGTGGWGDETAARARAFVRQTAARVLTRHPASAALVTAILIGDRAGLDDGLTARMREAGTYHVIAISGGNIALLTVLCVTGLRTLIRSSRVVSLLTIGAIVSYGWIVGGDPSVSRAVAAGCLYLACGLVGLAPPALNVLAVAAVAVVLADPLAVIDVGAWLSFGATLGIVVGAKRSRGPLFLVGATGVGVTPAPAALGGWIRPPAAAVSALSRFGAGLRRVGLATLGATVAAELALLPIATSVFWRVGFAGLALNFVAIPAMSVIQVAGLLMLALAGWWDRGAWWAGQCAHWAARALEWSSYLVERVPWLTWRVPPPSLSTTVVYYGAALLILRLDRQSRGRSRARAAAAAVWAIAAMIMVTAPGTRLSAPPHGWLRMTTIDVGQGDGILLQFPSGRSLLVDAGGAPGGFDVGERVVTPTLWALGVRQLDWLANTHADLDHIGGTLAIAATFRPAEVWEGTPVPRNPTRRALHDAADRRAASWRALRRGDIVTVDGVEVAALHPALPDWERQRVRNDDSLVLRLRYGDTEMLLTGDIGEEAERGLIGDLDGRPLRLLKVAHHGSRSSSSAAFLAAYRPAAAMISVGRGNGFGHPAPEVLARLAAIPAPVFRTDEDGAIVAETDGRTMRVHTVSGRHLEITARRVGPR
jgi:competence protein ComEC